MENEGFLNESINPLVGKFFVDVEGDFNTDKKSVSAGYVENDFQANTSFERTETFVYCELFDIKNLTENSYELDTLAHSLKSLSSLVYTAYFFEDYTKMYDFLVKTAKKVKEFNDNQQKENTD